MFFQQRKIKMSEGADFKNVLNDNFTSAADTEKRKVYSNRFYRDG